MFAATLDLFYQS